MRFLNTVEKVPNWFYNVTIYETKEGINAFGYRMSCSTLSGVLTTKRIIEKGRMVEQKRTKLKTRIRTEHSKED